MRIVYFTSSAFGRVYYDPQSRKAVSVADDSPPLVMGMKEGFDPYRHPDATELNVPGETFRWLVNSSLRVGAAVRDFQEAIGRFPTETQNQYVLRCYIVKRSRG
ncbi:MAG: hypothetical protein HYU56_02020 [Candidatus Aenigmarchaeota archaeon]|nr:hypothetical protein [Candidatus Aenigmarchaeota archaeon]